jgi:hypothetical protein
MSRVRVETLLLTVYGEIHRNAVRVFTEQLFKLSSNGSSMSLKVI